ncbi:Glycosyl transferase family 2 [Halorientalis persicus]|uniref:Glycosyl transferase family 2 n=1 Tax=Halorientalis persicus TaxID=1367881 RepID=A0A1H8VF73_9EURY|nr:glycosyltransferase [Halorientalis persicus]SEP14106.1 Glycosyl transferase family 2 [Halorientalis persicus]
MTKRPDLSVLLPVYYGDSPEQLNTAISSVVDQTQPPDELVIVRDGPLTRELEQIIERRSGKTSIPVKQVILEENAGLGYALKIGVKHCSCDYIARMDADDISTQNRFEKQTSYLEKNPEVDIVGGFIAEFTDNPDTTVGVRKVPTSHEEISKLARFRSPFNHATVVMRTDTVLSAGNYRARDPFEDWDLWSRMLLDGATAANLPCILLHVRAGPEMYKRRGGMRYARSELSQQVEFFRNGFISPAEALRNLTLRVPVRLVPNQIRNYIYQKFTREK